MTREESLALHNPFVKNGIFRPPFSIDCRTTTASTFLLTGREAIHLEHPTMEWIETAAAHTKLRALALTSPVVAHLAPLSDLRLYNLTVFRGNRIQDWSAAGAIPSLKRLSIHFTTSLTDLSVMEPLRRLEVLTLGGDLYRTMKPKSLLPLTKLRRLRVLVLELIRSKGLDFSALRALPRLERLVHPGA
jgi:hypothetical protein